MTDNPTQKIFAVAQPAPQVTWADLAALMQVEAAHAWALYERGTVRELWARCDAPGTVYVLESTPADAVETMARQPLARAGLVEFELVPVVGFACLSRLFGTQSVPIGAALPPTGPTGRILAFDRLVPGVDLRQLQEHGAAEAHDIWALWKAGVVRESHERTDRRGVVLTLETTPPDARERLAGLPMTRAGLVDFDVVPVAAFDGLDALFDGHLAA